MNELIIVVCVILGTIGLAYASAFFDDWLSERAEDRYYDWGTGEEVTNMDETKLMGLDEQESTFEFFLQTRHSEDLIESILSDELDPIIFDRYILELCFRKESAYLYFIEDVLQNENAEVKVVKTA